MKEYNVYLMDGTYIEILAEGWFVEDDVIIFFDAPEDEIIKVGAEFYLPNIAGFCEVIE